HPQGHLARYAGILQADAYDGYNQLYLAGRQPRPIQEAACWVHARRPFFAMADIEENARRKAAGKKEIPLSPIAVEVVRRIDALFEIDRSINGQNADQRKIVRQAQSAPLVADLEAYMREQCAKLSRGHDLAKAMNYMFKRWASFTRFLEDGRVCLSNNAAERGLRGIALGRKSWFFCGSDRGGRRAAAMYSLIVTAKMNGVDPQAWLADVLGSVWIHLEFITAAVRLIIASKLRSVLSARMAIRLNSLSLQKKFSIRCRHLYISSSMARGFARRGCWEMTTFAPRSSRSAMMALLSNALSAISASKASPSISGGTPTVSKRCPGSSTKRTRLPSASVSARILVVIPPFERPMAWFCVPLLRPVRGGGP